MLLVRFLSYKTFEKQVLILLAKVDHQLKCKKIHYIVWHPHKKDSVNYHFHPFLVADAYDYQGRPFLHIPLDLGVNLLSDDPPDKCFLPKKRIHTW